MPQNYQVSYSYEGLLPTFIPLTNVQSITLNTGRQRQLDQYNASTGTIEIRYPTGYASPLSYLIPGNYIKVENLSTGFTLTTAYISNTVIDYGIPYVGGVGNSDRLTVSIEGVFAQVGRQQGEGYAMPADTLYNQLDFAGGASSVPMNTAVTNTQPLSGTTVSSTWGDWLNKVLLTLNGRLWDFDDLNMRISTPFEQKAGSINFSDVANNATNQVYNHVNFGSYGDNYYTQVTVDPEGFAAVTVDTGVGGNYRTLLMNTLNGSTSQATDFANYLLSNYNDQGFELLSFSCLAESQAVFKLDQISAYYNPSLGVETGFGSLPGTQVNVTFRGTVFSCVIEGATMSATPESSTYTYYVSGADLNAYLLLNNAVFGRLDYNKLGY
jgi:hypothetical protein